MKIVGFICALVSFTIVQASVLPFHGFDRSAIEAIPSSFFNRGLFYNYDKFPVSNLYHAQDILGRFSYGYESPEYLYGYGKLQQANPILLPGQSAFPAEQIIPGEPAIIGEPLQPLIPGVSAYPGYPLLQPLPQQVTETPEVAKARYEHMMAIEQANGMYVPNYQDLPLPTSTELPLPLPVTDEPSVAKAKAEHLLLLEKADNGDLPMPPNYDVPLPMPVTDEPIVAKAKAEHLALKSIINEENSFIGIEGYPVTYSGEVPLEHRIAYSGLPLEYPFGYSGITGYERFPSFYGGFSTVAAGAIPAVSYVKSAEVTPVVSKTLASEPILRSAVIGDQLVGAAPYLYNGIYGGYSF